VKTPEFKTINGKFAIIINVKKSLPVAQIDCMLGIRFTDPDCGKPPAVVVNWTLWSEGKIVDSGPPKDYRTGVAGVLVMSGYSWEGLMERRVRRIPSMLSLLPTALRSM
jgi:hypothetical protein